MKNLIALFGCFLISIFFYSACATTARAPSDKVVVASVTNRSVTLTWEAPTTNTDGSPLTDLAGYNVYYGPASDKRAKMEMKHLHLNAEDDANELSCKEIESGKEKKARTECTYTVQDLSPDLHYFKVTAFNMTGQESDHSNEVMK